MCSVKEITKEDFSALMGSARIVAFSTKYEPRGLFYLRDGNKVIGIDNSTGHAWTEEFDSVDQCKRWLMGEKLEIVKGGNEDESI